MFIGHYSVAFALKKLDSEIPLGLLFIAVQFSDIVGSILVLLGIEKIVVAPGMPVIDPMDLTYYPFSHSLTGTVVWALIAFALVSVLPLGRVINKRKYAYIISGGILSHYFLDFITDSPRSASTMSALQKGLGIWQHAWFQSFLETALFGAGLYVYLNMTKGMNRHKYLMIWFGVLLVLLNTVNYSAYAHPNTKIIVGIGLVLSIIFSVIAFILDRYETD